MAFLNNIPQPGDRLKDSQPQILENFLQIYNLVGVNHANFNTANAGKHNFVSMPVQSLDPATNTTEVALYSRTSAVTGVPEMTFRRANSGAIVEMTSGLLAQTGWCYTPAGLLMKWGFNASGTFPINLNLIGPAYTNIYNIQLTTLAAAAGSDVTVANPANPASLAIVINGAVPFVYWTTLGV